MKAGCFWVDSLFSLCGKKCFRPRNINRNEYVQAVFELPKGSFLHGLAQVEFYVSELPKNILYSTLCHFTLMLCDEGTNNYYYMYSAISSLFIF